MTLTEIYKEFPTQKDCIKLLEEILWNGSPTCPYCGSNNHTAIPDENRFRCNACSTTYSVTARTVFHKTKCDLQKWFFAINVICGLGEELPSRRLAIEIGVTKDTAWLIQERIKKSLRENRELFENILKRIKS